MIDSLKIAERFELSLHFRHLFYLRLQLFLDFLNFLAHNEEGLLVHCEAVLFVIIIDGFLQLNKQLLNSLFLNRNELVFVDDACLLLGDCMQQLHLLFLQLLILGFHTLFHFHSVLNIFFLLLLRFLKGFNLFLQT